MVHHDDADKLDSYAGPVVFDFIQQYRLDEEAGNEHGLAHYLDRFRGADTEIAREYLRLRSDRDPVAATFDDGERSSPPRTERYRRVERLGQGGQGTVFEAEDIHLSRRVALKELPLLAGDTAKVRLKREAAALIKLDHPSICDIYEADLEAEPPYIVMRLVPGHPLAAHIAAARGDDDAPDIPLHERLPLRPTTPTDVNRVLTIIEDVARALHTAHSLDVIHRDATPNNIMITPMGDPVLLDFGLALDPSAVRLVTAPGMALGTTPYVAPEVTESATPTIDARIDVYTLGVVLHECLTLERPYDESSTERFRLDRKNPLRDVRKHNRSLPPELTIVLETALDPDPARRYATTAAFADDLARIKRHEPIQARSVGAWLRTRRWIRRHPVLTVLIASLCAVVGIVAWYWYDDLEKQRTRDSISHATIAQLVSESAPLDAMIKAHYASSKKRHPLVQNAMLAAMRHCAIEYHSSGGLRVVGREADAIVYQYPEDDMRHPEKKTGLFVLDPATKSETALAVPDSADRVTHVVRHPKQRDQWAIAYSTGRIVVWDRASGSIHVDENVRAPAFRVTFSKDGTTLAATGTDDVVVVDLNTRARRTVNVDELCNRAAFSPDGRFLATWCVYPSLQHATRRKGAFSESVQVFDLSEPRITEVHAIAIPGSATRSVSFSPDGRHLAVTHFEDVYLIRLGTWEQSRLRHSAQVKAIAFDEKGERFAAGYYRGVTTYRIQPGGRATTIWKHQDLSMRLVSYLTYWTDPDTDDPTGIPGDEYLLAVAYDGRLHYLRTDKDPKKPRDARTHRFATSHPTSLTLDPERRRLVGTSSGIEIMALTRRPGLFEFDAHEGAIHRVAISPRQPEFATGADDGLIKRWNRALGRRLGTVAFGAPVRFLAYAPDGSAIVAAGERGCPRAFRPNGEAFPATRPARERGEIIAMLVDQDRVITAYRDGLVACDSFRVGRSDWTYSYHERLELQFNRRPAEQLASMARSPSGKWVALGSANRKVAILNRSGACVKTIDLAAVDDPTWYERRNYRHSRVFSVSFSEDDQRLAVTVEDGDVLVFSTADWKRLASTRRSGALGCLVFDPTTNDRLVGCEKWNPDVKTFHRQKRDLKLHPLVRRTRGSPLRTFALHPETRQILGASRAGMLILAPLDGAEDTHITYPTCDASWMDGAFFPDGENFVTVSASGTVFVWPTRPSRLFERRLPRKPLPYEKAAMDAFERTIASRDRNLTEDELLGSRARKDQAK